MRRFAVLSAVVLAVVAISGCVDPQGSADGAEAATSGAGMAMSGNQTPLPPKLLLSHNQTSDDLATASSPFTAAVAVEDGFDQLLVGFAVSGTGTYSLRIVDEAGTELEATGDQTVSSQPDSHTTAPDDTKYEAVPGKHTATVEWNGAVTFTLKLTERSHAWHHQVVDHHR